MSIGAEDALFAEFATRRGLFGGAREPIQRLDFNFAEAGLGGAFSNPLVVMGLQGVLNSAFGGVGIMPAQFQPMQNLFDQYQDRAYWEARRVALAHGAQADRETYVQMLRGIAQMQGTPWGLEQQRAANVMAGDVAFMAPILAQTMPELFDALHGTRGSATVMASFLHRGGRYAVDPLTGRTGLSGEAAGALAGEMHARFFAPGADLSAWRGLSAGRAGMLYDELQTRGLMGLSLGAMTPAEQAQALTGTPEARRDALRRIRDEDPDRFARMRDAAGVGGLPADDQVRRLAETEGVAERAIRDIQAADPTRFNSLVQGFQAQQVANRLRNMAGAVSAMRDIFGDMGRPNAPMTELLEGINALTQGGLATMAPAELERMVRTTHALAEGSGMGLQAAMGLMAQGAGVADQLGLDRTFAVTAGQGAMAFGAAFAQVGEGDRAAWGRGTVDELTLLDQQLRLRADASPMANRLGAAMRFVEAQEAAGAEVRGPLRAMAEAVRGHRAAFTNERGEAESLNLTEGRWMDIMEASGADRATSMLMLRSEAAQQEAIHRYDIGSIVRPSMRDDARAMVAEGFQESAAGALAAAGVEGDRAVELAEAVAQGQARATLDMNVETRTDAARRNEYLAAAGRTALVGQLRAGGMAEAEAEAEADRIMPTGRAVAAAEAGFGRIEDRIHEDEAWRGYRSTQVFLDLMDERVQARQTVVRQEADAEVAVRTALGGVGQAGPLRRLMDIVQDPPETFGRAVAEALGGVDPEEVRDRLEAIDPASVERLTGVGARERLQLVTEEMMRTAARFRAVEGDRGMAPEARAAESRALETRIVALRGGGGAATAEIRGELERAGAIAPDADPAAVTEALRHLDRLPEEVRNRVLALRAAGGGVDTGAIETEEDAILSGAGLRPDDRARALAGELDEELGPAALERLRQLEGLRGGMDALAADSGIALGAAVGSRELEDVTAQRDLLDQALGRDAPAAERERFARNVVERGGRWSDVLLGDAASVGNLGRGGFELARRAREAGLEQLTEAREAGLDVVQVLAGTAEPTTDRQRAAAARITDLQADIDRARAEMVRRLDLAPGEREAATPDEEAALKDYQAEVLGDATERNRRLIETTLGDLGGATRPADADLQTLAESLGTGDEGEVNRRRLGRMADAGRRLREIAGGRHMSLARLRAATDAGELGDEGAEVSDLLERAGRLGEGETADSVRDAIREITAGRPAEAAAGEGERAGMPDRMALSGQVRLVGLDTLDFGGAHAEPGSTPVG